MEDEDVIETLSWGEYLACFRRRRRVIAGIAGLVLAVAIVAALVWPPEYQSTATILIDAPQVPSTLVQSTVTQGQGQLLQSIQQRVMTTENLMQIIDKYHLYPKDRNTLPASVLADRLRRNTNLAIVKPDANMAGGGRQGSQPIAFTLTYNAGDPQIAQEVASELVTLYLSENAQARQAQASGTVEFLSGEADQLSKKLNSLEAKLAAFRTKHAGTLPSDAQTNMQLLNQAESQISQLVSEQQSARELQASLSSQLSQIDPNPTENGPDGAILTGAALRLKYLSLSAQLGRNNPQVVSVRRQMEAMGMDPSDVSRASLEQQRTDLKDKLDAASKTLGANNPKVQDLQRQLSAVEQKLSSPASKQSNEVTTTATNPAYVQIQAQLAAVTTRLKSLSSQEDALRKKVEALNQVLAQEPEVARAYTDLERSYKDTLAQYQTISGKQNDAELASNLEAARKGERLSVIDPPELPDIPVSPKRKLIVAVGFVFATILSLGSAIGLDALSGRIYGQRQLSRAFGGMPLAVVPSFAPPHSSSHKISGQGRIGRALRRLFPRRTAT